MIRRSLHDVPGFQVPTGFRLRSYWPGDEQAWYRIHAEAELHERIGPELFRRRFGEDLTTLKHRQIYLESPTGETIGTATAWHEADFDGAGIGRVHYVAIVPRYQGQGLSKPLMTEALLRLRELGDERAYLATTTVRLPAINLYLGFGFEPLIREPGEHAKWAEVLARLRNVRRA